MMVIYAIYGLAIIAKRVNIAVTKLTPITKFNAEFEGCAGRAHKLCLVNAERIIKETNMGQGSFSNTYSADFIRFDQSYLDV